MSAHLAIIRNPFHPMQGRELRVIDAGQPLSSCAPRTAQPFILLLNGSSVLRKDWQLPIGDNDLISVVYLPRGGGGGGSNPLKIVLSIAVAIIAQPLAVAMLGELAATAVIGSVTLGQIVGTGVSLVGESLINFQGGT